MPSVIWSDNGTKIVAPENEKLACLLNWNAKLLAEKLAHEGINCIINVPEGPLHGVFREKLPRCFTEMFYALHDNRLLTDEISHTLFCFDEWTLNNRPLTHYVNKFDALTPNHPGDCSSCLPSLAPIDDFNKGKRHAGVNIYPDGN